MSYIDEGYIKFDCTWEQTTITVSCSKQLLATRDYMHQLGLIGFDKTHQVGYGNISERIDSDQFIISGTQTGHILPILAEHFTQITGFNIPQNQVNCQGPAKASSETMTHASLYDTLPEVHCIIHVHSKHIWEQLLITEMCTGEKVPYGTPEMAYEIKRLVKLPSVQKAKIMAMAGHEDGVISFGATFDEAINTLKKYIPSN
jgi:L-ribulose-5-phosphate 4-epimerase